MSGHLIKSRKDSIYIYIYRRPWSPWWRWKISGERKHGRTAYNFRKKNRLLAESIVPRRQRGESKSGIQFARVSTASNPKERISIFSPDIPRSECEEDPRAGRDETRWRDNSFSKYRLVDFAREMRNADLWRDTVPALEWISPIYVYCSLDLAARKLTFDRAFDIV